MGLRKRSFTYSGNPVTWRDAKKKAKREGRTFSDVVELLLQAYNKAPVWKSVADGKPVKTVLQFIPEEMQNDLPKMVDDLIEKLEIKHKVLSDLQKDYKLVKVELESLRKERDEAIEDNEANIKRTLEIVNERELLRKERDDLLKWLDYEIQRDGALYRAGALSHVKEKLIRTEQKDKPSSHE